MTVHRSPARGLGTLAVNPLVVFTTLWKHRVLILELTRRDVTAKYRGSLLGLLWSLLSPLLMLAAFTFVFTIIFESRWDVAVESRWSFALVLFTGLIVFWFFSDCVNRAPSLMFENVTYVKRVVFPLEILPWVVALSGGLQAILSALVLLVAHVLLIGVPPHTALLAPLILFPLVLLVLGLCWFLASLGVFLQDMRQIVPVIVMLFLFLSPVFYPMSAVPDWFRFYVELNPLAVTIEQVRGVLFFDRTPSWIDLCESLAIGWTVAWLGLSWFEATRRGFADVL